MRVALLLIAAPLALLVSAAPETDPVLRMNTDIPRHEAHSTTPAPREINSFSDNSTYLAA